MRHAICDSHIQEAFGYAGTETPRGKSLKKGDTFDGVVLERFYTDMGMRAFRSSQSGQHRGPGIQSIQHEWHRGQPVLVYTHPHEILPQK